MNLLILTSNPERASYRQRIEAYLPAMREAGIEPVVKLIPKSILARRKLLASSSKYDGALLLKKGLGVFAARLLRKSARRIIFNYDDAVWLSPKRPERYSRTHSVPWSRSVSIADMVIVGSKYLAEAGRRFNDNVRILPIGVRVKDYAWHGPRKQDGRVRLVWIGSESTVGYLGGIIAALEELGRKYPNLVVREICDTFIDVPGVTVEKFRWEADKRGQYLHDCDIGLAPLPDDPFTRGKCSFKVLEYAASGLPTVASPVGTNGEHIVDNVTGFLARSQEEWVAHISRLVEDSELRGRMGAAGREHAASHDTAVIGARLCTLIKEVLS